MSSIDEAKRGSAEILILALLEEAGDTGLHGYDLARLIEAGSSGTLRFTLAALYTTLYRLEERVWIRGRWVEKSGHRRRRYYRLTENGKKVLATQREDWGRFIAALSQVAGVRFA